MNKELQSAVDASLKDLDAFIKQSSGEEKVEYGQRQDPALCRTFEWIRDTLIELNEELKKQ
jgi:hypothetical protein